MVVGSSNPQVKEIAFRRRIASIFNKREDDFPSLREYNDYLEEVENMRKDVAAIDARIAQYEKENAEQIMINRARKAEELAAALAASKGQPVQDDADVALNQGSQAGFGTGTQGQYAPTISGQPRPVGMGGPQPLPLGGVHDMHGYDDEEMMQLRVERGPRAGGWSPNISRKRALEEAFSSIWVS
ncbi:uncharacterized protein LOC126790855 isoform X2 [Argentina anserina]|uniref:uncharacterized protein LOC126790855 isoform X2 n=1 Tax=Argentina anserina TaxID=57926 RepID=UPI0021763052|nr:uncharacterized protein LOC126790855 isoform X2 [Potentilla anserina]